MFKVINLITRADSIGRIYAKSAGSGYSRIRNRVTTATVLKVATGVGCINADGVICAKGSD